MKSCGFETIPLSGLRVERHQKAIEDYVQGFQQDRHFCLQFAS
jgi:hypothetical protein